MKTNIPVALQAKNDLESVLMAVNDSLPLRKIEEMLDRTDFSADTKSIVLQVASRTMVVAGQIIQIGRKIVSFALELAKTIPNTLFGVALALVMTALISGIPKLRPITQNISPTVGDSGEIIKRPEKLAAPLFC
jgi:hypothetical protein